MPIHRIAVSVLALAIAACSAAPQAADPGAGKVSRPGAYAGYAAATYDGTQRTSFYLPMRDGTKLAVDLFRPTKAGAVSTEKLPVVWMHTPYNRRTYNGGPAVETYPGFALRLAPYGYNVAVVDFRGVYASYGNNVAYNRGEWADAAKTDAYDVTEWFAKQDWSNGSIGMWGCSATGGSQMQALTTRPPHLKAVIPMSAEFDAYPFTTLGGVSGPGRVAPPGQSGGQDAIATRDRAAVAVDGPDGAKLLVEAIASHKDNVESVGVIPFRDSKAATGEVWWMKSSPSTYLDEMKKADIGVMDVANWDEAGTRHGPFFTFNNLNPKNVKLLVGPSTHCAWSNVKKETGFDLVTEELRFYDFWLKGVKNGVMEEKAVTYYTYNAPAGQEWRTSETWPPKAAKVDYYLADKGALGPAKPAAVASEEAAFSAPAGNVSTTIDQPTGGLAYETAPLATDIEVTGHPVVTLWIATKAGDADVTARLYDVAPDGSTRSYQMLGRLRASHRTLATPPYNHLGLPWMTHKEADMRAVPATEPVELKFDLLPMSYIFKTGHKVRLALAFTDPQRRADPQSGVSVLHGPDRPSRIELPIVAAR